MLSKSVYKPQANIKSHSKEFVLPNRQVILWAAQSARIIQSWITQGFHGLKRAHEKRAVLRIISKTVFKTLYMREDKMKEN